MLYIQKKDFVQTFFKFLYFIISKSIFSHDFFFLIVIKICYLKINISYKVSINFHHIPQNDTRHHFIQTWQRNSRKTRNTTRLKCWPATQNIAKWRWRSPKCCTYHEKYDSFCENDIKILRLPHYTISDYKIYCNLTKCHAHHACHTKWTLYPHDIHSQKIADTCRRLRTLLDGCGRLRTQMQRRMKASPPPDSQNNMKKTYY